MDRKLKNYIVNCNIDLTDEMFNINTHIRFTVCDLLFSILADKKLTSTEKSILGIVIENCLGGSQYIGYDSGEGAYAYLMASDVTCYKNSTLDVPTNITTDYLSYNLKMTKKAIFNNIHSLIEKGIIDFGREKFSEYGRITLNIGYLVNEYYR